MIMLRQYETILIFTPVLSDEQINNAYKDYNNFLNINNANIIKEEKWGMKKLSYKIKNKNNGFFYCFTFKSTTSFIKLLNNKILLDERIIRFLIIKMNKYAIQYSNKKKIENEEKK
ncbi:MAG: 30S ribosomal protein S6 [Candidatus Shikimatogenerans bostrichidophilus]|nr:MAG: 30S ribosomal protein S6 [Candidatus Shikimatogenerans bostrichidophilus]